MSTLFQKDSQLPNSRRIVFLGDSNTNNGMFIAFMDAFFMQHMPDREFTFVNLGVNSETVSGLSEEDHPWPRPCLHDRLERALRESRPDWVVLCYGMNDGIYHPFSEERFQAYQDGLLAAIRQAKKTAEKVIVMTPPPYDHMSKSQHAHSAVSGGDRYSWKSPFPGYNEVLRRYADWVLSVGNGGGADAAVNIFDPMTKDLEQIRAKQPGYTIGDGIHPNARGHWIIARTLLSRLFNVTLERMPDFVEDPAAVPWFLLVMQRHRLLSAAWKEHVGHTNLNKADALPLSEALGQADLLRKRIVSETMLTSADRVPVNRKITDWNGYSRTDFYLAGREAIVVRPIHPAPGRPWIWRAEFFDAFTFADRALLEKGWHIAYYRLSHMYGCSYSIEMMNAFRACVIEHFGLAPKPVLFGFSRGGLYAVCYATAYPERVSALYLDAPVLDIRSWPGGKGEGTGAPAQWEECLAVYGLTEETAATYESIPLSSTEKLANAGIPVLIVAGDADKIVPFSENGAVFEQQYREAGGSVVTIMKPGVGHHPHSLENPEPIVSFIERYAGPADDVT